MAFTAQTRRNNLWFGTENRMDWFPTPNRGADVSPQGWGAGGTLLNGGGYELNSFGSHKNYIFEWPGSSSREVAQKMKSYADGSFGRGLIYFLDPLTWTTNVLPAMWADPSMGVGYEGSSLVYGVEATGLPSSGGDDNELPVTSAYYDLSTVAAGWRGKEDAVFIPIPEGYTLALGSIHTQSGTGRVFYREQATNGALGTISDLTPIAAGSSQIVNTFVSGASLAGIWLYVGKTSAGAGSVTLTAMTGRIIETAKTQSTLIAENLFTNPRLVGDGTYATVAENLFTNPRLVGDGTWAEVRRNLIPTPNLSTSQAGWSPRSGVSVDPVGGGAIITPDASVPSGGFLLNRTYANSALSECSPGDRVELVIRVRAHAENTSQLRVRPQINFATASDTNGITTPGVGVTMFPGQQEVLRISVVAPAGAERARPFLCADGDGVPAGQALYVLDGIALTVNGVPGLMPFSGSSPQGSIDPDMRQRWLGAENASESVMEIERVRGMTPSNCVAGVSTKAGKPAVRLIPTAGMNTSEATFPIPLSARANGTAIGTLHLDAPLAGALAPSTRVIAVQNPWTRTDSSANLPGSYPLRLAYGGLTSDYRVFLRHGGSQGSGDVWWTDIGLFAGNYTGGAFSGDTTPETAVDIVQPEDFQWRWTGAANASESVMEIERVRGLATSNAVAGVSTWEGEPAVRIIPTGTSSSSRAYVTIPAEARSSGTAVATVRTRQALPSSIAVRLSVGSLNPSTFTAAPSADPGSYPLRHQFVSLTGSYQMSLWHGSTGGESWWTDIGLFAGDYSGPAFSGDSSGLVINGKNVRTQWDGTPDNSVSSAWTVTPAFDAIQLGPWIGGQGHSGCRFAGKPTYMDNTGVGGGQVGFAASFREVGSWANG